MGSCHAHVIRCIGVVCRAVWELCGIAWSCCVIWCCSVCIVVDVMRCSAIFFFAVCPGGCGAVQCGAAWRDALMWHGVV